MIIRRYLSASSLPFLLLATAFRIYLAFPWGGFGDICGQGCEFFVIVKNNFNG